MRRRKGRSEASNTQNPLSSEDEDAFTHSKGFFACYLLLSLSPRYKGHTYIGFTVNPRRRIRQHNGEIGSGAFRTKKRRPWEMVLCIYGFPTNVSALQFEWAWQHPVESLAVRKAAATFKSLSGVANKIKLAYTMLTLPSWQSMNITVNFFSTKYMKHSAGCPSLPEHMKVQIGSMDELPCYTESFDGLSENEDNDDTFDGSVTHLSPQNKESEARESCHSFAPPDEGEQFDSTISQMRNSSPVASSIRAEIMEDTDFTSLANKSSAELSQPDCKQPAEIIDLSTPSPSCRRISDSKKRRNVSCVEHSLMLAKEILVSGSGTNILHISLTTSAIFLIHIFPSRHLIPACEQNPYLFWVLVLESCHISSKDFSFLF
ncbi:Structure-specific endonuclease subunit SLX1 [Senna tora]|uniref:Structure-specific endonuclease subunit SLX1 homolog n=1 Tax=Senna tora TaxID=362788 RepID=A0A834WGH3_9FABA|nr:Structure-specific endonuclease subunit SLX1 [Senna tora]